VSGGYRDVPPITLSLVRIMFFIRPVIWTTDRLGGTGDIVVQFNPLAYLIEIVRDPLLGITPPLATWAICIGIAVAITVAGLYCLALTRHRLAYWL